MEKEYAIVMNGIVKEFKVLNRREGLKGSLLDLFSRDYRTVTAVDDISVKIPKGQIVGYLGPNGVGKSTTIKMMTGVLEPTRGELLVNGCVPYISPLLGILFFLLSYKFWMLGARKYNGTGS